MSEVLSCDWIKTYTRRLMICVCQNTCELCNNNFLFAIRVSKVTEFLISWLFGKVSIEDGDLVYGFVIPDL